MKYQFKKMNEHGKLRIKHLSLLVKTPESSQEKNKQAPSSCIRDSDKSSERNINLKTVQRSERQLKTKKGVRKKVPVSQPKIESFFKSCSKSSTLKPLNLATNSIKNTCGRQTRNKLNQSKGRKRLFVDTSKMDKSQEGIGMAKHLKEVLEYIDLCSESGDDIFVKEEETIKETLIVANPDETFEFRSRYATESLSILNKKGEPKQILTQHLATETFRSLDTVQKMHQVQEILVSQEQVIPKDLCLKKSLEPVLEPSKNSEAASDLKTEYKKINNTSVTTPLIKPVRASSVEKGGVKKTYPTKTRPCPSYKVVAGTSFTVDAFQFREIKGITHYFLSHFHADHYVGLTRTFAMPVILSPVTAKLVRAFIPVKECLLHEIELNQPQIIEGVEVTAIDANHCPGAVMFVFKLPTGKCILHTGDFRASPDMESEPVFWNNDIDLIYLDTTYISNKYNFCTQDESIWRAQQMIHAFRDKHAGKKILFICGAYLIGKEKFWSAIAHINSLTVWTEEKRSMALGAMRDEGILELLCSSANLANMHVINMGKLSYFGLVEYFEPYSLHYDLCLAIRPSGWETHSKPQYRGKINIIGIQYSEHSSHNELQRFVTYLRPNEVISTVPVSNNPLNTSTVPEAWYKYKTFPTQHRNYQTSITSYMQPKTNLAILKNDDESIKENHVSNLPKRRKDVCEGNTSLFVSPKTLSCDTFDEWLSLFK